MQLNEETFLLFAAKYYDNPNCTSSDEFIDDLNRIKYLKKLFFVYRRKGILRDRLILNHLVILYNVFDARACTKMLVYKLEDYLSELLPFLECLGYLPDIIEISNKMIRVKDIFNDETIELALKAIGKDKTQ